MSDTGWIVLGILGVAAVIVIIVLLLRKRPEAVIGFEFSIRDQAGAKFVFSPGDARTMLQEVYGSLSAEQVKVLRSFNTKESKPSQEVLEEIDKKVLDALVHRAMIQDPERDEYTYRPEQLRLAYSGWQMLEAITARQPLGEPWRWPTLDD